MRKSSLTLFLTFSLVPVCYAASIELSCEKIQSRHWGWVISGYIMTCFLDDKTTINKDNFSIGMVDESVDGLLLEHNQKIEYLPINIHEKFPNLIGLTAYDCQIQSISKENFQHLDKLKELHLSNNKLEKIYSNTFEDLESLEVIFLGKNKIHSLNGETFERNKKLTLVSLMENLCVDTDYSHRQIGGMYKELSKKCGFEETVVEETTVKDTSKQVSKSSLGTWTITLIVLLVIAVIVTAVYIKFFRPAGMRYF